MARRQKSSCLSCSKYRKEKLNRNYSIFVGNGGLYVPQELRRGADGIMTGFAFIEMLVNVFDLFNNNSKENSEDLFDLYLPLIRHEQQFGMGLALRKFILQKRGVIKFSKVRAPGPALTYEDIQEMNNLLKRLEFKLIEKGFPVPYGIK